MRPDATPIADAARRMVQAMTPAVREFQDVASVDGKPVHCHRCGNGLLAERRIQTAFWRGEGLVVIRNIPAMVCQTCGAEHVSDRTATGLDRMRGKGFTAMRSIERMIVPVLDYVEPGGSE